MKRFARKQALGPNEAERLEILRRTLELIREHRDELPHEAVVKPNPADAQVALVQRGLLSRRDFERLYCRGFLNARLLRPSRLTPEERQAMSEVRQLLRLLERGLWSEVEEGRRHHPLDVR